MFLIKGSKYDDCSSFVDLLFIPWAYWGSNTIHRPRFIVTVTLENLDVAELDRNVTKRERSQQNVAGREET